MKRRPAGNSPSRRGWRGFFFISPWLIGFLVFTAGPFVISIFLSFTRYDVVSAPEWVGGANYRSMLTQDPIFWKALWITAKYAMVAVPLGIGAGVGLALLLNASVRGISVYRTVFFLPSIVPVVATSVAFTWLLNPQIGLVNGILRLLGVTGPAWPADPAWAFWSLVMIGLWGVGGSMIIYLAGLKDIPVSLYEAAMIDGAGPWQRTRHVTLPMLTPVILFNLVMGGDRFVPVFHPGLLMTGGGPEESTTFYALYPFCRAWRYLDMGYASAMAWVLFVIVTVLTGLIFWSHKRWVHHGG